METKQNYFVIGCFVLAGIAAIFIFAVWFSGARDKQKLTQYHIYFTESVNGLNVGSAVKYRGVEVGKVKSIDIDPGNQSRIQVTAELESDAPIKQDTIATLKFMGITGLVYVELAGGNANSPPLAKQEDSDELPVIPSKESQLSQVVTTLPEIADKFSRISDQLLKLLNDKNIQAASQSMQNMQDTTMKLADLIRTTGEAMEKISSTATNVEAITSNSRKDAEAAVKQAHEAMQQLTKLLERTNEFSAAGYSELNNLLLETKKTMRDVQSLSKSFKDEPSKLIVPVKPGGVKIP